LLQQTYSQYALHTQFQDLALKGSNSPTKELSKGGGFSVRSAPNEKTLSIKSRKSNAEDIGSLGKSSAASRSLAVSATYIYKIMKLKTSTLQLLKGWQDFASHGFWKQIQIAGLHCIMPYWFYSLSRRKYPRGV
jgi:hypothetical protein